MPLRGAPATMAPGLAESRVRLTSGRARTPRTAAAGGIGRMRRGCPARDGASVAKDARPAPGATAVTRRLAGGGQCRAAGWSGVVQRSWLRPGDGLRPGPTPASGERPEPGVRFVNAWSEAHRPSGRHRAPAARPGRDEPPTAARRRRPSTFDEPLRLELADQLRHRDDAAGVGGRRANRGDQRRQHIAQRAATECSARFIPVDVIRLPHTPILPPGYDTPARRFPATTVAGLASPHG